MTLGIPIHMTRQTLKRIGILRTALNRVEFRILLIIEKTDVMISLLP